MNRLVDLSHVITDGMTTYPGLPTPLIADHLSRAASEQIYGPGTTFQIGLVTMCTNTGTYLDHAVLIRTDHAEHWGTDAYFVDHPHLTESAADALVRAGVACVGIDTLNIDDTSGGDRPVHTVLLGSDIPIVEHLVHLDRLPATGFSFTAVPPTIEGAGTFTVRAYATL